MINPLVNILANGCGQILVSAGAGYTTYYETHEPYEIRALLCCQNGHCPSLLGTAKIRTRTTKQDLPGSGSYWVIPCQLETNFSMNSLHYRGIKLRPKWSCIIFQLMWHKCDLKCKRRHNYFHDNSVITVQKFRGLNFVLCILQLHCLEEFRFDLLQSNIVLIFFVCLEY